LRISDTSFTGTCQGLNWRELLRIGSLALGGLTLSQLLKVQASEEGRRMVKDKAVVLLFLQGGPNKKRGRRLRPLFLSRQLGQSRWHEANYAL
jgi:hypothetical protein